MIQVDIPVTRAQINECIRAHQEALMNAVRDCGRSHPPGDGTVGLLVASLDALSRMRGVDDDVGLVGNEATVDVGANEQTGERVTVKKRVVHGRKDG